MGQGRIAFPVQYFARAVVSLSRFRSTRRSCNILHGFHPVQFRRNGGFARGYAADFFCLRAAVFETPQSAAQTVPLAGEPWRTADNSKVFHRGKLRCERKSRIK